MGGWERGREGGQLMESNDNWEDILAMLERAKHVNISILDEREREWEREWYVNVLCCDSRICVGMFQYC